MSVDLRDHLSTICTRITKEDYRKPRERVPHRWGLIYECTRTIYPMLSALSLLYWVWLSPDQKASATTKKMYEEIRPKNLSTAEWEILESIHTEAGSKALSSDGLDRKKRVAEKLWLSRNKTLLHILCYLAKLKDFSIYLKTFQINDTLIHIIYDKQQSLLKDFLTQFVKVESIVKYTGRLEKLDLDNKDHLLADHLVGMGTRCKKHYESMRRDDPVKACFLSTLKHAYVETAKYLIPRIGSNSILKHASVLNPSILGHTQTHVEMLRLLQRDSPTCYQKNRRRIMPMRFEAFRYQGKKLPKFDPNMPVDKWWNAVINTGQYLMLSKVVKATLCIFTAP